MSQNGGSPPAGGTVMRQPSLFMRHLSPWSTESRTEPDDLEDTIVVHGRDSDASSVGVSEPRVCQRSSDESSVGNTRGSASSHPDSGDETCTRASIEDLPENFLHTDSERSDRTSRTSHTLRRSITCAALQNLDDVLNNELRSCREESDTSDASNRRRAEAAMNGSQSDDGDNRSSELVGSGEDRGVVFNTMMLAQDRMQSVAWIIDNRWWQIVFMLLTLYALFCIDFDLIFGDKESKFIISIVTTAVFGMFLIELVVQSLIKPNYVCRAYFWLDLVALLSLLPDTWLVQALVFKDDSAFAAGRSSKVARIIRVAARSTKATRLNRLTRIVRVATLMPRLLVVFGKQGKDEETQKVLSRKLRKIFAFLDEDLDGYITREELHQCLRKLRAQGDSHPRLPSKLIASESSLPVRPSRTHFNSQDSGGTESLVVTATTTVVSARTSAISEPDRLVDFDEFMMRVVDDERTKTRLMAACRQQAMKANNMHNIASRHSEDVGVKVALGVLLTLLVLGVLEPAIEDDSPLLGLKYVDHHVKTRPQSFGNGTWSTFLREHVEVWQNQVASSEVGVTQLLYLDIQKKVFCNEFHLDSGQGQSCSAPSDLPLAWTPRGSLQELDDELFSSKYRFGDLLILRVSLDPNLDLNDAGSTEELNNLTLSSAVFLARDGVQEAAVYSVITTVFVIVIILSGIILLTRDLNYMSLSLMRPLRALADDMQSIVQLQIAALTMEPNTMERSCAEIRMIQRIFNNMKKAIKSWGKYVPWPVVQILLNAGVDAKPGVRTREVSIYFSDIAGFTSIVENLPPEKSLLLLSRYFNEMSKVIDENQGIVIEFIGDAIFAVFGAPVKNPEHPTACVKAAMAMLASLDKINQWSASRSLPEISIRCGVHTGRVLIGNMGYHSRMKYGCVGRNANVPDRLEELNKTYGTNLLISHATVSKISEDVFVVRPIDYVTFPPGVRVQPIYEVMARDRRATGKHKLKAPAMQHRRAMRKYRDGHFQQALEMFTEVNAQLRDVRDVEEDPPSALMIQRCRACIERQPERWTGVWEAN